MATSWPATYPLVRGTLVFDSLQMLMEQAKRRRSDKRGDKDLEYQHAGQMFAEMLGQVCYKEFFNNELSKYQEVPPSVTTESDL